ncbi:MAG: hypothetical protein H7Y00_15195 [Fimbriimonadaceae bacterium]|nr:hypothetical protein [Chitinophagales bacterium]
MEVTAEEAFKKELLKYEDFIHVLSFPSGIIKELRAGVNIIQQFKLYNPDLEYFYIKGLEMCSDKSLKDSEIKLVKHGGGYYIGDVNKPAKLLEELKFIAE